MGAPFAIFIVLISLVLSFSRWSPFRLHGFLAKLHSTTHPAALVWGMLLLWGAIITAIALFLAWGIATAVAVKPRIVGVGILLLIPSFLFIAWALAVWTMSGWSVHPAPVVAIAPSILDSIPSLIRIAWRFHAWVSHSAHPMFAALFIALLMFTGYELSVIFNGNTVTKKADSNGTLVQYYEHRCGCLFFPTCY